MTFNAKTVIPNRYWILRDQDQKVGNIESVGDGYSVRINNNVAKFKTIDSLCQQLPITFDTTSSKTNEHRNQAYGFDTSSEPHNAIWDVKKQVPLWTKEPRSKSWMAAGWYRIRQHRDWHVIFCPKAILLDRYAYQGPYHSRHEAQLT
jgi:hypothetical protein